MSPNSGPGAWKRILLPQGQVTLTYLSSAAHMNFVPPSFSRALVRRILRPSRSGTTNPTTPRSTSGFPVGMWNCCWPALIHMFSVPVMMYGSRVSPRAVT